jgi:hypothetical protein
MVITIGGGQSASNNVKVMHLISGNIVDPNSLGEKASKVTVCPGTSVSVVVIEGDPPGGTPTNTPNSPGIFCDSRGCNAPNVTAKVKYISRSSDGKDTDRMTILPAKK